MWERVRTRAMAAIISGLALAGVSPATAEGPGISPEAVADMLHAVIEADRTFYTIHVVERVQRLGAAHAAESWRSDKKSLPLPAQFLHEASDLANMTGTQVRYRLISLWPINSLNSPASEHEKVGLEKVREHPERPVTTTVATEGQHYFQAIYADRAVTQTCIDCHNHHPKSPKKDFKTNDVMGGLVIEFPLHR